jgi:Putative Actinobacterial Holin-X, holin superfamily III
MDTRVKPAYDVRNSGTIETHPRSTTAAALVSLRWRDRDMLAPSSGLLRTGLALKLSQIKLATRSYLRDRTHQATGTVTSYAIAAGLFAAAGIFVLAACLVGAIALFRWIEIRYGMFPAFGAIGALLLVIAATCAAVAVSTLKRPPPHFPSLTSRLRVAVKSNPVHPDQIEAARDTAAAILLAPSSPGSLQMGRRPVRNNREVQAGLILVATLLGWAATRRRQQARRTVV